MLPFVHIHIPKTAGSTRAFIFQGLGVKIYSETAYLAGVSKRAPNYEDYDVITGHFFATLYDHLPLVTFLRDPVERVISHYAHFQRAYKAYAANDGKGGLPWDYENTYPLKSIDVIEFASTWPNLMTRYVTGGNFEFVGVVERLYDDLCKMSIHFEFEMPVEYKSYRVTSQGEKPEVSMAKREMIGYLNKEDIDLYNDVKAVRKGKR